MPNLAPVAGSGIPWGEEVLNIAKPAQPNRDWANRPATRNLLPIFDLIPKPVLLVDAESGQIVDCNQALTRLLSKNVESIMGSQLISLWPPEYALQQRETVQNALRDEAVTPLLDFALDSGRRLRAKASICGFFFQNHPLVMIALDDRTHPTSQQATPADASENCPERRRLENLRIIAGGIAHNFNNILMSILSYATLGRQKLGDADSETVDCFRKIEGAALRAGELSRRFLLAGIHTSGALREQQVNDLIHSLADPLRSLAGNRAEIRYKLSQDIPLLAVDKTRLSYVLTCVVQNAVEAIHSTVGLIQIRTFTSGFNDERRLEGFVTPSCPEGPCVVIEVSDNGIGIAPEHLQRIFEPFYSTKFVGRGLSLAEALGIVCSHKGAIQVVSHLRAGTLFRIYLPVLEDVRKSLFLSDIFQPPKQSANPGH